jgi:hypothetical protein
MSGGWHTPLLGLGTVACFNHCIRHARGHWVHILHGDDTVRPGFYKQLRTGVEAHPEAGAALTRGDLYRRARQLDRILEMEARDAGMLQEDFVSRQLVDQKNPVRRNRCASIGL